MDPADTNSSPSEDSSTQPNDQEQLQQQGNVSSEPPINNLSQAPAEEGAPPTDNRISTLPDTAQPDPSSPALTTAPDAPMMPSNKPKKPWRKVLLIVVAAIVVLSGGAAAYYNLYLTHQPWYVLDNALNNTLAQTEFSASTTANIVDQVGGGAIGFNVKLISQSAVNLNNKEIDETLSIKVGALSVPIEVRLVNNNLYFKLGDLSSALNYLNSLSPTIGAQYGAIASELSNRWVEVNSTTLNQNSGLKCLLNTSWTVSGSDSNYITSSYLKQPFFSVISTSNDSVNGASSEKLMLSMDNYKAAKYLQGLASHLSLFKSSTDCPSTKTPTVSLPQQGKTTPLTVWVDKATGRIDQIAYSSNKASAQVSITSTISYGNVNVAAPSGAESFSSLKQQIEQEVANHQLPSSLGTSLSNL